MDCFLALFTGLFYLIRQDLAKLHARIQEFSSWGGGGGGPGQSDKKTLTFFFVFLVLILFYLSQIVNFQENYHFSRFKGVSNIFQGVHLFPGGGGPIAYSV